jgi:hypothetical protein
MLSEQDKKILLSEFPKDMKLSYENIIHKKVYNADINLAIPCGIKSFVWFTLFNNKNICLLIEIYNYNIQIKNACFSSELSYGTILYGTFLTIDGREYFTIEDIYYYKNKYIKQDNWGNKLILIKTMLQNEIKQITYNSLFITFALPLLSNNLNDLSEQIKSINYKIEMIQFRLFNRSNNYLFIPYQEFLNNKNNKLNNISNVSLHNNISTDIKFTKERIFLVKPTITNDIYHLFIINNEYKEEYFDVAYIPDIITSVMMNKLFRNIKENDNLDRLEESDDESEFENVDEYKYVYMDKSYKMLCTLHPKFKKWVPIKVAT